jgi:hypothetical protein
MPKDNVYGFENFEYNTYYFNVLPPFQNIRCFSFVKQIYLDIFGV